MTLDVCRKSGPRTYSMGRVRHLNAARQVLPLNCSAIALTAGQFGKRQETFSCGVGGNLGVILRDKWVASALGSSLGCFFVAGTCTYIFRAGK